MPVRFLYIAIGVGDIHSIGCAKKGQAGRDSRLSCAAFAACDNDLHEYRSPLLNLFMRERASPGNLFVE